ncbi:alcohol dehydrogenase zinc-binding domain protein [Jimgerdemannia flammicorona]|uniref:Alcohol dehydrogenase zinc-binding domain protein n=2 Tax=Jimgerdemannia flammicorona TaxID=994334 RepID=A0A433Q1B0_9FUNG|nr:alcohol dehydrogenase zinc-binding domain protein [Jimgerdemannia flammicorona]RUS23522.1 alcohol dehydrogenase zinc-binding domain protein [Jimgerdemannia flammicorona]
MRAAILTSPDHSHPPKLELVDTLDPPVPSPGQVLIKVDATSITPAEYTWPATWTDRAGEPRERPIVLGHDLSGVIHSLALGDSTTFQPGDAVYALTDFHRNGAQAEYAVANLSELARRPRNLDPASAAGVPLAALTAYQALVEHGDVREGMRVLVHGGAGGVGMFAVQMAKRFGARVLATASAEKVGFVKSIGADEVVDYRMERFEDVVGKVDVVVDTAGGETLRRSYSVVVPGGVLVTVETEAVDMGLVDVKMADKLGIQVKTFIVRGDGRQLEKITDMIEEGHVKVFVDRVFPLKRAMEAVEYGEGKNKGIGKTIIKLMHD